MEKKRFSGWGLQSEHNFLGGFGGMPPQANFEIFNATSCILSISERVLMFENKYIILLCFVVYNQFQIWIWIKLHCLLYFPIVYLMFNNLSIFFQFIPIHYWHPDIHCPLTINNLFWYFTQFVQHWKIYPVIWYTLHKLNVLWTDKCFLELLCGNKWTQTQNYKPFHLIRRGNFTQRVQNIFSFL